MPVNPGASTGTGFLFVQCHSSSSELHTSEGLSGESSFQQTQHF